MNKLLLFSFLLATCPAISQVQNYKGLDIKTVPSTMEASAKVMNAPTGVSYKNPVVLANIGSIAKEDNAVCNYLFRHKDINQGAYLLASGNKAVTFVNNSTDQSATWTWTAPGTAKETYTDRDLTVQYTREGVFDFPTLSNGTNTYQAPLKIKSGGTSEITTINTLEYGTTYQYGAFAYGQDGGFVGGTNKVGIVGWGNLFMLGTDDAYLDGINIYLHHKPVKYAADAKLLIQVWYPSITQNQVQFRYLPIEALYVPFTDIKDASDGVWTPTQEGAVINVKFDTPVDLYGKTLLFVTVEGFGTDPATEDFCLLTDITGSKLPQEQMSNLLAHNSFGRMNGENDYLRPISFYGGGTGSFAICPVIRTIVSGGVESVTANQPSFNAHFEGENLAIQTEQSGNFKVYDIMGRLRKELSVEAGTTSQYVPVENGIYIVQGPNGKAIKIKK